MSDTPTFRCDAARNSYNRISKKLKAMGLWDEVYISPLALVSMVCADYLTKAASNAASDYDLEELRIVARKFLSDFLYISVDRVHLAVMDSAGIDRDILELCSSVCST